MMAKFFLARFIEPRPLWRANVIFSCNMKVWVITVASYPIHFFSVTKVIKFDSYMSFYDMKSLTDMALSLRATVCPSVNKSFHTCFRYREMTKNHQTDQRKYDFCCPTIKTESTLAILRFLSQNTPDLTAYWRIAINIAGTFLRPCIRTESRSKPPCRAIGCIKYSSNLTLTSEHSIMKRIEADIVGGGFAERHPSKFTSILNIRPPIRFANSHSAQAVVQLAHTCGEVWEGYARTGASVSGI